MDFGALDLRHLRLVRAVVEEGTLTAAADRLALSQPALSHRLRDVEDRLGVSLFERSGRSLVLTEAGRRVLDAARVVLGEVARAEADLSALAAGRKGTLRVTAECYTTYNWLPPVLGSFREAWPLVDVEIAAEASERPGEAVRERTADVALLTTTTGLDDLELLKLFEDEVVAVVDEGHPWAGQAHVEPAAFHGAHVFAWHSRFDRNCVLRLVASAGAAPERVTPVPHSTEGAVGMVRAGLGVTTMAAWAAAPYLAAGGLRAVSVTPDGVHRTWYAATRASGDPGYVGAFVEALTSVGVSDVAVRGR
ncbi:MAG: LysR family transcriptional regulator [Bacteroidota bacterium]